MRDRFTGQARGFGFVEINDDAAAQQAVDACHGKDLLGRTVVVNEARPMAPREGGGGGRPPRY
jgi:RNA recognition motif-containing protein